MNHFRFHLTAPSLCCLCPRLHVVVALCVFFGGCGTYFHDDALQTKTDSVISSYKTADVQDAVASAVAAQRALDAATVQDVITRESAARDALIAPLMLQQPNVTPAATLQIDIRTRIALLAGNDNPIDSIDILGQLNERHQSIARLESQQMTLDHDANSYRSKGGTNFTNCNAFSGALSGASADLVRLADHVKGDCYIVAGTTKAIADINQRLQVTTGEIGATQALADQFASNVAAEKNAEDLEANILNAKKTAVVTAASDTGSAFSPAVLSALKDLGQALDVSDDAAGVFGITSPGKVLANVKFRDLNLCDVVAAEAGKSCTGAKPTAAASEVTAAIGNLSAGLSAAADAPDAGVTSVALAYQAARGNVAQTVLNRMKQQQALAQAAQNHLMLELGYLQLANAQLKVAQDARPTSACANAGFGEALTDRTLRCPSQYRTAVAQALVAVNQSFSRGRVIARADVIGAANLVYTQQLEVAQQVTKARAAVLQIVITEIGAYGQGGIKPETIAAFLQAFGIVAIAAK